MPESILTLIPALTWSVIFYAIYFYGTYALIGFLHMWYMDGVLVLPVAPAELSNSAFMIVPILAAVLAAVMNFVAFCCLWSHFDIDDFFGELYRHWRVEWTNR